jgi:hypothetical protein
MALDKIKEVAQLLDGKGSILIRNANVSKSECGNINKLDWFVHCHWNWSSSIQEEVPVEERIKSIIFKGYVTDLDKALDEIITKLGGTK